MSYNPCLIEGRPLKHMRFIRLWTLIAVVLTLPVYGVAFAAPVRACASKGAPPASSMSCMGCCDHGGAHAHRPGEPSNPDCLGTACQCAHSGGPAQAFVRPSIAIPVFSLTRVRAISRVAALLTADSPQGLWRPPRAL
jgi:hypothetical protein